MLISKLKVLSLLIAVSNKNRNKIVLSFTYPHLNYVFFEHRRIVFVRLNLKRSKFDFVLEECVNWYLRDVLSKLLTRFKELTSELLTFSLPQNQFREFNNLVITSCSLKTMNDFAFVNSSSVGSKNPHNFFRNWSYNYQYLHVSMRVTGCRIHTSKC